jgi:hypothetical protein
MSRFRRKDVGIVSLLFALTMIGNACVKHDLEPPIIVDCTGFQTVSFSADIQPIIGANCAIPNCHNGDNGADKNWTDPVKFQNHASEARRRVLLPKTNGDHMPRVGVISEAQIKLIVCWAEQGAPINN